MNSDQRRRPKSSEISWTAEDLDVFRRAYALSLELHRSSLTFPKIEQYAGPKIEQYAGLADQLRRARYLSMAVGSAEEARLWCRYAADLGYVEGAQADTWRVGESSDH